MIVPERWVLESLRRTGTGPEGLPRLGRGVEDWRRAIRFAEELHAAPVLAVQALRAPWADEIPGGVASELGALERRGRMSLALLDIELRAALEAILGAGIPALLLKGADLGRRFYPDPILRPMGDVDVLVPGDRFQDAWHALENSGFSATERRFAHSFRTALARSPEGASVDLHASLTETDTTSRIAMLWDRSLKGQFTDLPVEVRSLSVEDCLVYVLRHSAVLHVLESPIWLSDLHFLISRTVGELDWELVLSELRETGSRAAAWFVFGLLAEHWQTPIPSSVLGTLASQAGILRRAISLKRSGLEDWFPPEGRSVPWMVRTRYLMRESAQDAAAYACRRWVRRWRERAV